MADDYIGSDEHLDDVMSAHGPDAWTDGTVWGEACICGHVEDEHDTRSRSCCIDGCDCPCFEQEGEG